MGTKLKPLAEQVIVVTGASSGFGLLIAREAAAQGARVVLGARTGEALDEAVRRIAAEGGEAIAVVADVTRREDLETLATRAVERFGRIDTWVNNAGVGIWGVLEEVGEADMRQLFEVNFWGLVNGSLVAIPHLEAAGGGALVNIGSVLSERAVPLQGIYAASKHAVKGFTDALRVELGKRGAPVAVTLVKPWSAATPLVDHVKNYTGREPVLPPPVLDPQRVADAVLRAVQHPTRDAYIGTMGPIAAGLARVAPGLLDWVSEATLFEMQLGPETGDRPGNLWQGNAQAQVRSRKAGKQVRAASTRQRAASRSLAPLVALGALVGAMGLLALRRR